MEPNISDHSRHSLNDEQLLDVFRHCPAALVISRWSDRTIVEINDAFTELFGWTRAEAIGRHAGTLVLVDPEVSAALRARLVAGSALHEQPLAARTRDNEIRDVVMGADLLVFRGEQHAVTTFVDITARRQVQVAVNRLAAIVESSDDAIISKDLNGIVMTWNRGAERVFGYAATEMVGNSILRIIPEDRRDEEAFILEMVARGENLTNLETRRVCKDGRQIEVSVTTSPIRDAAGTIVGVSKIARDMTGYRRAEAATLASEARYRALFEHAPDGILIADDAGRYIDANPAICRMLGYDRDRLVGLSAEDIVSADETPHIATALETIRDNRRYHRQWRFRRSDDSVLTAEVIGALMPDGMLMGMVRDVSERNRIEARFRRLVESNAQGVAFWRRDGRIVEANDAFLKIAGYSREELVAGEIDFTTMTPSEYADADNRAREQLSASGVCAPYEKEFTRTNGSRVPVLVGAATFADDPSEGVSFIVDLTERKRLEQQFLRAQRMESIGTLAGGIAHDLNNILAPILLSVGLLKAELPDARLADLLETVQGCAQRGADLVQQVLSFARGVEGQRVTVNPLHVVRDVVKVARDTFPRSVDIKFETAPDVWTVKGDPTQMHQVFLNLCVNARDAMPDGGRLAFTIENIVIDETFAGMNIDARPGAYVVFTVSDTGAGIAPEIRERIFEPFFTTKDVGKGTGLGLSTTLAIVKSNGGFMHVYSEVRQGTKFKVYWPASLSAAAAREDEPEDSPAPRGRGECILVVDDEAPVRAVACATLERFGYRVLAAANGAEALGLYASNRRDIRLVITDMAMPIMDGPATVIALKTLDPAVKIIGSSGLTSNDGMSKAVGAGVVDFVPKPYTADVLLRTIRTVLDRPETETTIAPQ